MTESNPTGSPSTPATDPPNRRPRPNPTTAPPLRVQSPTPSTPTTTTSSRLPDPLDGDGPADTGTPSSDRKAESVGVDAGTLRELARGLVLAASGFVHDRLATTDEARRNQVWIADDHDQAQIGHPLADLAERYGLPSDVLSPDTRNLIASGIGVAVYAAKNIIRAWNARRADKARAAIDPVNPAPTEAPA